VENPYATGFSAGGSSSGCGALIGSGEVDMGVGGDQGGSIRIVNSPPFELEYLNESPMRSLLHTVGLWG
jgi:hypothetical protein